MKKGFTLAEVLVTLAVIGVVAALVMPQMIQNYKKKVAVARMQKFYSSINQAVRLSEAQNGFASGWDGVRTHNPDDMYDWWNKYLNKYLKSNEVTKTVDGISVILSDGSGFGLYMPCSDKTYGLDCMHIFYCVDYKSCKTFLDESSGQVHYKLDGKNTFLFNGGNNSGVVPYGYSVSREELISGTVENNDNGYGCSKHYKAFCAALIMSDGWQIKSDYPVKF